MAILTTGNTFSNGDQVTAAKLNAAVNSSSFASGAVDSVTTQLSSGKIIVKDGGITPAKLSTGGPSWDSSGNLTIGGSVTVPFLQAGTGAVETTQENKLKERVSVKDFGAVGSGDETVEIQAAIDAATAGSTVNFPSPEYTIGEVRVEKNLVLDFRGVTFNLSGNNAGFGVHGNVSNGATLGGKFIGDYVDRGSSPSTAQIGILVGNESRDNISDFIIDTPHVRGTNVGIKVADGSSRDTPVTTSITAITKAKDGVVTTSSAHGISDGESVRFTSVGGMIELNGNTFVARVLTTTTFSIGNTTNYTTYTSSGTGTILSFARNCKVLFPVTEDIVGTLGGVGYGVQFAQAPGSIVVGLTASNCGRHGLYFSEGKNYTAIGIEIYGCGIGDGSVRGALSISRSENVTLSNYNVHDNIDCGIVIDVDSQGLVDFKSCNNINIGVGVCENNLYGDYRIGTSSSPASDGVPSNITINHPKIKVMALPLASPIVVNQVDGLIIESPEIDGALVAAGGTLSYCYFSGIGGAQYTDNVIVRNPKFVDSGVRTAYGFEVVSALCSGSTSIKIIDEDLSGLSNSYSLGSAVSNNSLLYGFITADGGRREAVSTTGASLVLNIGGVSSIVFSSASTTSILNFTGGVENQEIDMYFTNGHVTLKNTNFYTLGAVDFVSTANDVVTFKYLSGHWREKCRSVN